MINAEMERRWWYKQIHAWITNPGFRMKHPLHEIIENARDWGCKMSEYLKLYPQDERIGECQEDL